MRLYRFVGSNTQDAIDKVQDAFGLDAMIVSTNNFPGGVEILACPPGAEESTQDATEPPASVVELNIPQSDDSTVAKPKPSDFAPHFLSFDDDYSNQNLIFYYLNKLGFRNRYFHQMIHHYIFSIMQNTNINEAAINQAILHFIPIDEMEMIYQSKVCALLGPTGIGKTTTIIKIALRYISKYGSEPLGLIMTDHHVASARNQLSYYSNLFNIDLEYANSTTELNLALDALKSKKLILIDTYGISQKDQNNVNKLLERFEAQTESISSYVVLPCNVQEQILEKIAEVFASFQLKGCILTKQDESTSIAHALSISIKHKLNIAYICNGQDINHDIEKGNKNKILKQLILDSEDKQKVTENNNWIMKPNIENFLKEDRYERSTVS